MLKILSKENFIVYNTVLNHTFINYSVLFFIIKIHLLYVMLNLKIVF